MNSKQLNFFLVPEDMKEISSFLSDRHCLILKRKVISSDFFSQYDIVKNPQGIFQVCLSKKEYMEKIYYEALDSKEYFINILKSYCIEFSLGGFYPYSEKELHQSRFYVVSGYYDDEAMMRKNANFMTWAEGLLKSFKKQFLVKSIEYPGHYFSERCLKWMKENYVKKAIDGSKLIIGRK